MRKKVLILSYYWPPAGGPGVQRILKFVKYLRFYNWEPVVITPEKGSFPSFDDSLLKDIPDGVEIHHTKTMDPFFMYNVLQGKKGKSMSVGMIGLQESQSLFQKAAKYIRANFFIPDARIGWNRYALKTAKKIIDQQEINACLTTGPPHSTHLIGLKLKEIYNLPWIADLRDPWTNVYYNAYFPKTATTRKKDKAMENIVLRSADQVTVISNGLKSEFEDRAKAIEVIPNGFDEEDIYHNVLEKTKKFTLAYTGNLKPNQNIEALWRALKELKEEKENFIHLFRLKLVGNITPSVLSSIEKYDLKDLVDTRNYVSHFEATRIMFQSSLLLFIVPESENNHLILTGKLFEYLASCTPMLSIGPVGGDAAKIIKETDRGEMIEYKNKDRIKHALEEHFDLWVKNQNTPFKHNKEGAYKKYSRKSLTGSLAELLNSLST